MEKGIRVRNRKYSVRVKGKDKSGIMRIAERGGFKTEREASATREEMLREIGA